MIRPLPRRARSRLAELVRAAVHDADARAELAALARPGPGGPPPGWLASGEAGWAPELHERARRASVALAGRPAAPARTLAEVLEAAAALFDAQLYFEVHELLEPWWRDAVGPTRETLQGLIQVAAGYHHVANGNLEGGRTLLDDGITRLAGGRMEGLALEAFARAVRTTLASLAGLDWSRVPPFPRAA